MIYQVGLRQSGIELEGSYVKKLLEALDIDGSGTIYYEVRGAVLLLLFHLYNT